MQCWCDLCGAMLRILYFPGFRQPGQYALNLLGLLDQRLSV